MPLRLARVKISIKKGRSSSKKRLFSYALLPPSKRIYLGSPPKGGRRFITLN